MGRHAYKLYFARTANEAGIRIFLLLGESSQLVYENNWEREHTAFPVESGSFAHILCHNLGTSSWILTSDFVEGGLDKVQDVLTDRCGGQVRR
jgi:hypothetical protein